MHVFRGMQDPWPGEAFRPIFPLQRIFRSGLGPGAEVSPVREGCCLEGGGFGVGCCGWRFFAGFGASQAVGASEDLLSLGIIREGLLPAAAIESSGEELLSSRGDWQPPGVRRFLLELWVRDRFLERVFMSLGRRGGFLGAIASFDLSGVGRFVGGSLICVMFN